MAERTISIQGEDWHYRVGKGNVVFRKPSGKTVIVRLEDVLSISYEAMERRWKSKSSEMYRVTPNKILSYIVSRLL